MTGNRPEPHTLAGAYAMDALDAANLARFERHLARCADCAAELAELREVTGRLAAAAAVRPPAGLKEQLLARTQRIRQLPPVVGAAPGRWRRPRWRCLRWPGRTGSERGGRRVPVPVLALALALVAVAAAAIWVTGPAWHGPPRPRLALPAIAAILTAPDATMIDARVRSGGMATVVMSRHERMLVFAASGLPGLPVSRRYELWLMGRGRDRPAGLLPMPRHGTTGPVVASGLRSGDRLGLTVEPASGSGRPTSSMILLLAL